MTDDAIVILITMNHDNIVLDLVEKIDETTESPCQFLSEEVKTKFKERRIATTVVFIPSPGD